MTEVCIIPQKPHFPNGEAWGDFHEACTIYVGDESVFVTKEQAMAIRDMLNDIYPEA